MDIRTEVNRLCKEKGKTQKQLAKDLGITPIGLNQILRKGNPSLQTLERIASVLDVSIIELFGHENDLRICKIVCPKCGTILELKLIE